VEVSMIGANVTHPSSNPHIKEYYRNLTLGISNREAQSKIIDECLAKVLFHNNLIGEIRTSLRGEFPILELIKSGKIALSSEFVYSYPYLIKVITHDTGIDSSGYYLYSELKKLLGEDKWKALANHACLTTKLFYYSQLDDVGDLTVGALDEDKYVRDCSKNRLEYLKKGVVCLKNFTLMEGRT
jgi:hypothetical protein